MGREVEKDEVWKGVLEAERILGDPELSVEIDDHKLKVIVARIAVCEPTPCVPDGPKDDEMPLEFLWCQQACCHED